MGTGYTRNDSSNNIADGNVINASDFDGEFDAIVSAFATDGHTHDGTAAEGGPIAKLGPSQQVEVDSGAIFPASDGATDLGKSVKEWKDLYIDGVINTDDMSADTISVLSSATIGSTIDIGSNASVGGTLTSTGAMSGASTLTVKGAVSTASTLLVSAGITGRSTLDIGGNASVGGTLDVTGATSFTGAVSAKSTLAVDGDIKNTAGNLTIDPTSHIVEVKGGDSVDGTIQFNCRSNSHGQKVASQPHSAAVDNQMLLPKGADSTLVSEAGTATLSFKTLDSVVSVSAAGAILTNTTLDVAGETSLGNVSASGTLDVSGNMSGGGTFTLAGKATFDGDATVQGTLNVGGVATVDSGIVGKSTLDITGNASVKGTFNITGNVSSNGTLTTTGVISDGDGNLRDIPTSQNVSGAYTLQATDAGNQVNINSANVVVTVPASIFGVGDIISLVSVNGCTATIACTAVNAIKAGELAKTASYTLAANGVANVLFSYSAGLAVLTGNI
tara:strand:+ start:280 stop:1785 length:1506 start_codon:yes stop_codon:yes gene_type:complete